MSSDFRMSTPQENLTPTISKTGGAIATNIVAGTEKTNLNFTGNIDYCEKNSDTRNFKIFCAPSIYTEASSSPSHLKIETFGDLLKAAERFDASTEEPDEKTDANEEFSEDFDEKSLLDIKPTVLQKERFLNIEDLNLGDRDAATKKFLNARKALSKKRFSEFFKSLCVLCDICDDRRTERVIKLNRLEKIVGAVLLKKSSGFGYNTKKVFQTKIPQQSCHRCFTKIILLYNRYKNNLQRNFKREPEEMEEPSHGYDCQCQTCQSEYGALPVLLKGIEEQSKMQSSQVQVGFQPEQNPNIPHNHHSESLANIPLTVSIAASQEQVNFPQYSSKCEEESKPFQAQLQEYYYTSQSQTQSYSHFQMPESQSRGGFQSSTKTEECLDQSIAGFSQHQRLNVGDQSQYHASFQSQSRYYVSASETHVADVQTFGDSTASSQEQHLPTLLQDIENKCQADFASQPSTSTGIQSHHQPPSQDDKQSKKVMTCIHCDKNFTHKGDFNKHLRKHTKERPYKCASCDKTFSHTSNLHRHERIHSGDKPFRCEYCDKVFNRKDKLESHKNSKFCRNRRSWK